MQGSGYRVQGSGFRVEGSGCRVQSSGLRGFRVLGLHQLGVSQVDPPRVRVRVETKWRDSYERGTGWEPAGAFLEGITNAIAVDAPSSRTYNVVANQFS